MKRIIALIVTVSILSTFTLAFAANQTSPVVMNITASTFSVALPTTLPVTVDSNGVVTTATDTSIINNSFGPVKVSDITVSSLNGWSTVDYDSLNSKTEKVNAKKIAIDINNCKTTGSNIIQFTQSNFNTINGGNSLQITYNAKLPTQATAVNATDLLSILFTISWDKATLLESWDSNPMTSAQVTAAKLSFNSSTGTITSGSTKPTGALNLPSSVDGVRVTMIAMAAFAANNNITTVTLPNSITNIAGYAFADCNGITSINIPNSVITMGDGVLSGCTNLSAIVSTSDIFKLFDNTYLLDTNNGKIVYAMLKGKTTTNIPSEVTSIDSGVFNNNTSLTSITIPNSVTTINDGVFAGCTSLTSIIVPNSVTWLGYGALQGCTNLASVTLSNSITTIGPDTFTNCINLTSITIPSNVTQIWGTAFNNCTGLTSITVNKPSGSISGAPWGTTATVNWVG